MPTDWLGEYGRYRYGVSFWYMPFESESECRVWIPEMMGYGGNIVSLLPNGMTAIRLADAYDGSPGQYDAEGMARVANHLVPFCPQTDTR